MPLRSTSPFPPVPVTDEAVLNTFVPGDQFDPVIAALGGGGYVVLWSTGSASQTGPIGLRAQRLDADGNKLGGEILVDDSANNTRAYRIEALAGGGFAIIWHDNIPGDGGAGTQGAFGVRAQLYTAAGTPLGAPIQVNTTTLGSQQGPEIAELTDGKFVVTWMHGGESIRARLFAADGTPLGADFQVNTNDAFEQQAGRVTALLNGGFVITWQDHSGAGAAGQFGNTAQVDVRAQFYDSNGAAVGGEILVNTTTPATQNGQQIATLAGGNVVIAWQDFSAGGDVRAQLFDPAGNKLGAEILVNASTIAGTQFAPVVEALAGGGFVVSWLNDDGQASPRLRVFDAAGNPASVEVQLRPADGISRGVRSIVALADGGFAVGFERSPNGDVFNMDSLLQVFRADGTPVADAAPVHADPAGNQWSGDFAIGADGRLLAVWTNGRPQGSDPANIGMDVKYRLFDSINLIVGEESAEGLTGTSGIDLIDGRGGDDSISGLAGNDYLNGGAGADHLDGGAGNDTYYVDNAGDVIVEAPGGGNDRVAASVSYALAAGVEVETLEAITLSDTAALNLTGNEFANRIIGNAGTNILSGGGGEDRLEGGGGNDFLVGGSGADQMFGNSGNDTYYVDSAGDRVFEAGGDGVDRVAAAVSFQLAAQADVQLLEAITLGDTTPLDLVGNEIGQTVVGNAGVNLIDGGAGTDVLIGLGGADTFRFATPLGAGNVDRIEDFQPGTDRIALDDAVFTTLTPGALPPGAFVTGTAAADADDRIVYDSATGRLFYDSDGNGAAAAVQFASVTPGLALAASDFVVI